MKAILKRYFFNFAVHPLTYILTAAFGIFLSLKFFIGQQFFLGAGTTDLHRFFSAFPPACILFIPGLVSISSSVNRNFALEPVLQPLPEFISVFSVCCMNALFSAVIPICVSFFGDIEASQLLVGFAGILFYLAAAVSFTVFIFRTLKNTGAAFIVSAFLLACVNSAHIIPLYMNIPDAAGKAVRFISFAWRFDPFSKGIFSVTGFLFLVSCSVLFYALSYFVQEDRMGNCSPYLRKTKRAFAVTFILFIAVNESLNLGIDFTPTKTFSVSRYSRQVLSRIEDPLSISYYLSPRLKNLYPQVRDITEFLESYAGQSRRVSLEIINPSKKEAERLSEAGIRGYPMKISSAENETSTLFVYSAIKIDYLGKSEVIPFALNLSRLEFDLTRKIESLTEEKSNPVQLLCASFPNPGYSLAAQYLEAEGFSVIHSVLPSEKGIKPGMSFNELPDVPLVVFGSDTFTREDCSALERFILDGGKVFAASQPFSVDFEDNWMIKQNESNRLFERLMFTFGIYFKQTLTCDISSLRITMSSTQDTDGMQKPLQTEYVNYPLWILLRPQKNAGSGLSMFWPCAFDIDSDIAEIEDMKTEPLLFTSARAWQTDRNQEFITNPFAVPKSAESEDEYSSFTLCAASAKKNSKAPSLILFADQYTFSDSLLAYNSSSLLDADSRSLDFLCSGIFSLTDQTELLELKKKTGCGTSIYKIDRENFRQAAIKTLAASCGIPAAIILMLGFVFSAWRRRFNR
ncbi:Gldg family protein [Treponema sp.]|uniref:Gldg family protein n=1 Tax=Treponema sp. TaxID=166 RepID=UPI003EFD3625